MAIRRAPFSLLLASLACGRTQFFDCQLTVSATALDFGLTAPGATTARTLTFGDSFNETCALTDIQIADGGDPGFAVLGPSELGVAPGGTAGVTVVFSPSSSTTLDRHATLTLQSNDPSQLSLDITLSAQVSSCQVSLSPSTLDFGSVAPGTSETETVEVSNSGTATCDISAIALGAGSDPEYQLTSQPQTLVLPPGADGGIDVTFASSADAAPYQRTGTLTFVTNSISQPDASVPLTALLPHCSLGVSPVPLDFGNVVLNSTTTDQITLFNDGGVACDVSGFALAAGSDQGFTLPSTADLTVPPGAQAQISVTFQDWDGDMPPLLHQGTLDFTTGDPFNPMASVPLEAYVNTACLEASQWIYTVDENSTFSRFDPQALTFTDIGILSCPTEVGDSPFSMAVDQNANAWVLFEPSGEIFEVNTTDASCSATGYLPGQGGLTEFGMSFVFQPTTGTDTLYVAGAGESWNSKSDLATIAFPSLTLTTIAPVLVGNGELAGTGDGELWDFVPNDPEYNPDGGAAFLAQLDPATAGVIQIFYYPTVNTVGGFATKFWGGSFWIFLGAQVYQVPRATGVISQVIGDDGRDIVGAGVSTCAPVQ